MKKHVARRLVVGALSIGVIAASAVAPTVATAGEAPVRLIIGFKAGTDTTASANTASALGAKFTNLTAEAKAALAPLGVQTIEVPASRQAAVASVLRRDPSVAYVEVDGKAHVADVVPDDPEYTNGNQPEADQVKWPTAWSKTTGSAIKIAVVDTGVAKVGDLTGAVAGGYNYWANTGNTTDDNGHGTAVSSLIAARGNNGAGMAGACWSCTIIPVKVLNADGMGYASDIAKGITYASNVGAQIINLSIGLDGYSQVVADAVKYANSKGVLVVAAAGNEGTGTKMYPAALPDVVSVGATSYRSDGRVYFSNYGDSWVDLAAPGEYVTTMATNGTYNSDYSGTSFSSPIVAGVAGLIKSAHPDYNSWSLQQVLFSSARKIGTWNKYGMVDAGAAVNRGTDRGKPTISISSPGNGWRMHGKVTIKATTGDDWSGVKYVDLYVNGTWVSRDNAAPHQFTYDTKGKNGKVTFLLKATDRAGNQTSTTKWITADNITPSVSITSAPKNKAKVKGTVTVNVKASDKNGIKKVELLINGKVKATDTTSGYVLKFKAASQPKTMKMQIRAYDNAGNVKYVATRTYTR
ncbi:S8 family serine peptidase [Winogradskya humida]|uniref:Peptidase S8/S53 domain-containing protein n=1 Tax=Winogradskya humida TaxID=113566 RepID=A0ABQ3ZKQ7_9ACTN|nr:S8 family serine peptidase [Actinoplanes humidus]GIE19073.1 hypothetical protein Ahu01nite_021750 [Actinoplanes humidus]